MLKRVWAAVAIALCAMNGSLWAQTEPLAAPAVGASALPVTAFTLRIDAPDEIRSLLERHLELLRYQALSDLSDNELLRLMNTAQQDTQDLLATEGYFSPQIKIEREPSASNAVRAVRLIVKPGDPTRVSDVRVLFTRLS